MDIISSQILSDYNQARFEAILNRIWHRVTGQPTNLLSFDEIKQRVRIGVPIYRGVKTVKLDQIVGSLNRHKEFDRDFRPTNDNTSWRWKNVNRAFYDDISLLPVELYKIGEIYFVVDGHHRVSVARKHGQVFIDGEVREYSTRVKFTPELKLKDLDMLKTIPVK
jgi:hypothetical protein